MNEKPSAREPDLFPESCSARPSAADLREKEHFGLWDARCGMPLVSGYSRALSGDRLAAYERGFRAERARQIEKCRARTLTNP